MCDRGAWKCAQTREHALAVARERGTIAIFTTSVKKI
jgi:hypothetical protein